MHNYRRLSRLSIQVAYDDGVLERLLARVESPVAGIAATGPARLADRLRETQASEPALTPEEATARVALHWRPSREAL